ncbi:MAG: restriction endonuclease subunit S [Desulfobacteraceae bacterium]|nr:restriction endonuclease subunit S [Desulfobacteraceae bacterium]
MHNVLPNSWKLIKIGDICSTTSGGTPSRKNKNYYEGKIPWLKSGELNDGMILDIEEHITNEAIANSSTKIFPSGTLLIALYGATVGKLGILTKDAATNQAVCAIFLPKNIIKTFIFWYLRYIRSDLIASSIGGAQPNINQGIIRNTCIPLAPFNEQKRIVKEIEKQFSRLDKAVDNLKCVKSNLKRYKASVLKSAVEGKLTEEWRKDNPDVEPAERLQQKINRKRDSWIEQAIKNGECEPKRIKNKLKKHTFKIPKRWSVPSTWLWTSFLAGCKMVIDCHNKTAPYETEGIPLVRTTNIKKGRLLLKKVKHVSLETYTYWSRRCPPEPNDILFTREAPMGEAAIIPKNIKLCMGQRMMLLRVFNDLLSIQYLLYTIMSPPFQSRSERGAVGIGVKHLRVGDVESLVFPMPPFDEQKRIVEIVEQKLSVINEVEAEVENNLSRAGRFRQSILKKAFTGKLVPQENNSASNIKYKKVI